MFSRRLGKYLRTRNLNERTGRANEPCRCLLSPKSRQRRCHEEKSDPHRQSGSQPISRYPSCSRCGAATAASTEGSGRRSFDNAYEPPGNDEKYDEDDAYDATGRYRSEHNAAVHDHDAYSRFYGLTCGDSWGQAEALGLSDEQLKKLLDIENDARQKAKAVLTEEQIKKMGEIPDKPMAMMEMCQQMSSKMMPMMQKMMSSQGGATMMCPVCPMMRMMMGGQDTPQGSETKQGK